MEIFLIVVSVLVAITELVLTFRLFYSDSSDYVEGWRYFFTPDAWSLLRGEWTDDRWAELKLMAYHAAGVLTGYGTYQGLTKIFL